MTLKKHGGWKSSTVAEGYIDESVAHRTEIANKVFRTCSSTEITPDLRPGPSTECLSTDKRNTILTEENSTFAPNKLRNTSFV